MAFNSPRYTTVSDITVGQRLTSGTFKGATVQHIAPNGWVKLMWDNGTRFSARVHQLDLVNSTGAFRCL